MLRRAVASGVQVLDTAWYYGPDHANSLVASALRPYPDDLLIVAKVGNARNPVTRGYEPAVQPAELRAATERSLATLDVEAVHLLLLRWRVDLDHQGMFDAAWECVLGLQAEGKAVHVGLSNVPIGHIERAGQRGHVTAVSNAYSLLDRSDEHVVRHCSRNDTWYLPYYPLRRGMVGQDEKVAAVARRLGVAPSAVALAWLLRRSDWVLPIPGTRSPAHLAENLKALDLDLSDAECELLEEVGR